MKRISAFLLMTILFLGATWAFSAESISKNLTTGILRLHIIANSNDQADQELKLKVRDRLLEAGRNTINSLSDEAIYDLCVEELRQNGFNYPVKVQRGHFHFPRKSYENLTFPAGTYRAVKIILGEGEGENWWCVMYPPLCFTGEVKGADEEALSRLKSCLSRESFTMISESESITIKPTFKLVELWQEWREKK